MMVHFLMCLKDWMFIWLIVMLLMGSSLLIMRRYKNTALMLGNLMSYIGIIGTFVGIFQGLQNFNPGTKNVMDSLPALISGMRMAFVTSIVGMYANLVVRLVCGILTGRNELKVAEGKENENYQLMDLFVRMERHLDRQIDLSSEAVRSNNDTNDLLRTMIKDMREVNHKELLNMISEGIREYSDKMVNDTAAEVSTILKPQVQKISDVVTTVDERLESVEKSVENNSATVYKATKIATVSLKKVVKDFNIKINGQFKEDFESFSLAVNRVKDWQNEYKDTLMGSLKQANELFQTIDTSFYAIKAMENVLFKNSAIIDTMNERMTNELGKVSQMTHDAAGVVVDQAETLIKSFSNVLKTMESMSQNVKGQLKKMLKENTDTHKKALSFMSNCTQEASEDLIQQGIKSIQVLKDSMIEHQKYMIKELGEAVNDWSDEIYKNLSKKTKQINTQNTQIKQAMDSTNEDISKKFDRIDAEIKECLDGFVYKLKNGMLKIVDESDTGDENNEYPLDGVVNYSIIEDAQEYLEVSNKS